MASDPKNPAPGEPNEKQKMMRVLIPAGAIAFIVILVAVLASMTGGGVGRAMSDGSDGGTSDPGLKDLGPGVKGRDLKEGTGEPCTPGATVSIKYTGWLTDGTVFDSSAGNPVEFGLDGLIVGWQLGIPGMKPGGIRKLVILPESGYGSHPKGKIPGGSTLIFEVQLVSVSDPPRARRSPPPTDLTKLADGTLPTADDPDLKPIGTAGLMYRDIKVGDGPEAKASSTVKMDYIGWRRNDGFRFDTSWSPPGTLPLQMSLSGLIAGWQKGVPGMKVGGIRKLVIPPALGYPNGSGEKIPPNTTLVFEIELLGIK